MVGCLLSAAQAIVHDMPDISSVSCVPHHPWMATAETNGYRVLITDMHTGRSL